ncbi:amidohydrolase family protein [Corallococcus sp. bb12-1]|uniref:amidohydrolase family protein n=1 Tax=Corallococcus sp. bb12-1 TaxID=2996784 RepID=UPI00226EC89D|nr:amidohydrolase family protein [Corallococcus sp. bb12-1]MCY1043038.1 amidohydrolase family protein [Corallococcus sp. bb12-1]
MRLRFLTASLLAFAMLPAASAAPPPSRTVVFQGGRVLDGSGGAPLENAAVVVRDGRIVSVGPADKAKVPKGAEIIDFAGKTLLPGLISDHSHVGQTVGATVGSQNYTRENIERQLRQFAAYGVTTVTALGMNRPLFNEVRKEAHADTFTGADLFGAGQGIGVPEGGPPQAMTNNAPDQIFRPSTEEEARVAVRTLAKNRVDLVKVWVDSFLGKVPKMKPDIYQAVIDESHKQGLRVAAHIHDLEDARAMVAAGVDIIAHGVRDQPVDAAFIQAMKKRGVWYVPTLELDEATVVYADLPRLVDDPVLAPALSPELRAQFQDAAWRKKTLEDPKADEARHALSTNQTNLKALYDAGVKVGFGTDSGATPLRIPGYAEHRELKLMVIAGLTPVQALAVATGNAADLLKLKDRGRIAPGRRADLLLVEGDPATDITAVDRIASVWRQGRQVAGPLTAPAPQP